MFSAGTPAGIPAMAPSLDSGEGIPAAPIYS
jgi:hypothetical protein